MSTLKIITLVFLLLSLAINLFFILPMLIKNEIVFKKRQKRWEELCKEYDEILARYENNKEKQFALNILDELRKDAYSKETWSCGQVEGWIESKIDDIKYGEDRGETNE